MKGCGFMETSAYPANEYLENNINHICINK